MRQTEASLTYKLRNVVSSELKKLNTKLNLALVKERNANSEGVCYTFCIEKKTFSFWPLFVYLLD